MTQTTTPLRYTSPSGVDMDSVPWRLYDKAKRLFWDPAQIEFAADAADWASLDAGQQLSIGGVALGFMVGEEAVTLDILPLLRAISSEQRLEETMFLTTFAFEEAKHVEFFRRWSNAVGLDFRPFLQFAGAAYGDTSSVFSGELERVMNRLDTDRSPEAFLDASLTYNHFIEGVLALGAYRMANSFFASYDGLPGLRDGMSLIQRDERRHIAYGTYLCRRIIAEHPHTWDFVERRWAELTAAYLQQNRGPYAEQLIARRLDVLAVARTMRPGDVGSADELEAVAD